MCTQTAWGCCSLEMVGSSVCCAGIAGGSDAGAPAGAEPLDRDLGSDGFESPPESGGDGGSGGGTPQSGPAHFLLNDPICVREIVYCSHHNLCFGQQQCLALVFGVGVGGKGGVPQAAICSML